MGALATVPGVASITYHHTMGTDANVINRNYCKFNGASDETTLNNWALAVTNSWNTHLAPLLTNTITLNSVIIEDLGSASAATGSDVANHPGTLTNPAVPANCALVISYQINRRYRGGKPRQYIAGMPASNLQDEDHWLPAIVSQWEAAYTLHQQTVQQFASGNITATQIVNVGYIQGHTWQQDQHGNWHRLPSYLANPHVDNVNGYIAKPVVGTQRRRAQA